ncbi:MAG: gamma-glutamylcyclotransferase [Chitinophagaceae bacterium]|nr:MAG: gamma-glutamylcyclotransferase [Chitinophagaceae bacterium]
MESNNYLFVYGSLRSGFRNPAYKYLTQFFHLIGEAIVKGRTYYNGTMPVAVPTEDEHFISGELYELNNPDEFEWAIGQLDDYEGLNVMPGEKPKYRRDLVEVSRQGENRQSWIYWYNGDVSGMPEIEAGEVLKYLHNKTNTPKNG